MEWFSLWWDTLTLTQQILYCIAIPTTLLLVLQTILLLIGIGGGEAVNPTDSSGLDLDTALDAPDITQDALSSIDGEITDGTVPGDFTVASIFTFQGVVAFLTIFSWSSLAGIASGLNIFVSMLIGFVLGAGAMIGVAKLIQLSARLAHNGTINPKNLLGAKGRVYLSIPPAQSGIGKVTLYAGERFVECEAITEDTQGIPTNYPIRVIDIRGDKLVVEKET